MRSAPAINVNDLTSNIGSIEDQEPHGASNIIGCTEPLEQCVFDDGRTFIWRESFLLLRPCNGTWRNRVDTDIRRQIDRQSARQTLQPGFRRTVNRVASERTLGMNIRDIDDATGSLLQVRCSSLSEKQGPTQIASGDLVPNTAIDASDGRWVKARCVIDHSVKTPKALDHTVDELRQPCFIIELSDNGKGRLRANGVQFLRKRISICCRVTIV